MMEGRPNIAVRSGQGPGKSTVTAVAVPWWSLSNPNSLAVITAPTMRQCKAVWLSQAQALISDAHPAIASLFKFVGTGYGIFGKPKDEWGAYLATATRPEAFQGIHREKLLILCEESSGMDRAIIDTIKGTLSNADGSYVWLQVGNPNTRTCAFFDCFHSLAGKPWVTIHWNGEETPESKWFSKRRNELLAEEFGRDSDAYRVRVLGEFPKEDADSLINETDLIKCFGPAAFDRAFAVDDPTKQVGMDLARMGGDELVTVFRAGRVVLDFHFKTHVEPFEMIDRAVMLQDQLKWENNACTYVVDTSGMGESAVGYLGNAKKMGKRVHEFHTQNTAFERTKYANKMSEAWCGFAKLVRTGALYLGDKPDKRLVQQLTTRKYRVSDKGLIQLETKEEYKKRLKDADVGTIGKSPDRADALVMAFYAHASQTQRIAVGAR